MDAESMITVAFCRLGYLSKANQLLVKRYTVDEKRVGA